MDELHCCDACGLFVGVVPAGELLVVVQSDVIYRNVGSYTVHGDEYVRAVYSPFFWLSEAALAGCSFAWFEYPGSTNGRWWYEGHGLKYPCDHVSLLLGSVVR
jgi:hypothetical protein